MNRIAVCEPPIDPVLSERKRCTRLLQSALSNPGGAAAAELLRVAQLILAPRFSDALVVAEQSRCARIVRAAAYHAQDRDAAADHALAAIRLTRSAELLR